VRLFKSAEEKQQIADAEARFRDFIASLDTDDPARAHVLAAEFEAAGLLGLLPARERRELGQAAFSRYAATVLADDHLTEDEEDAFGHVAEAVGLTQEDLAAEHETYTRLQVAKLNAGRLPVVDSPHLIPKRGETVHFETSAALMKEVALREWRGRTQGVSIPIAKGVRYRVGGIRGHVVTVGTQLQVADTGILAVTSQRAAYLGERKTVDMPYTKLIGMERYSDGMRFSLSNRQNAPLFRVTCDTDVLGALLNQAAQQAQT